MSKTKKTAPEVPVLDKGNYNDKRNLLYFMEQEAIAAKMIEEARSFYDNFLQSKTSKFKDIIKYPNVCFIKPVIYAYYRKAWAVKNKCGMHNEKGDRPEDSLAVTVHFNIDFGEAPCGSTVWENFSYLIDQYTRRGWYSTETEYYKDFKNKEITDDLCRRYKEFEKKLDNYDYEIDPDGHTRCLGHHYVCDVLIQDLIKMKIHNPKDPTYCDWTSSDGYGNNMNIFAERYVKRDRYSSNHTHYYRVGIDSRFTEISEDYLTYWTEEIDPCPMLIKHPEIKKYAMEKCKELMDEFKPLFLSMIENIKPWKYSKTEKEKPPLYITNLMNTEYLFKRDGNTIELITNKIDSTEFDKKKGLYKIKCKPQVEEMAKYRWPSDGPRIRTEYYQTFVFDVSTNDLVDYNFTSNSDEIQYR